MPDPRIVVTVYVPQFDGPGAPFVVSFELAAPDPLLDALRRVRETVLARFGKNLAPDWAYLFRARNTGETFTLAATAGEVSRALGGSRAVELMLEMGAADATVPSPYRARGDEPAADYGAAPADHDDEYTDHLGDEGDRETAAPPAPAAAPPPRPSAPPPIPRARAKSKAPGAPAVFSLDDAARPETERRATVRYYARMNPDRMFPLLVVLSSYRVAEVVKARVRQAASEAFEVADGSTVQIEPVLPGCDVYPPRHALNVGDGTTEAATETFWVVPRVLGRVHGARVLVRQGDRVLADVPLDVKVSKQTLAVACGLLSLAAPYLTMGLKALKLDYESQKADGFALYQRFGGWLADAVRPELMGLGFLGLAAGLYFWMRPRQREVFWDVDLKK